MEVKDWIKEKGTLMEFESQRLDVDINTLLSSSSYGILSDLVDYSSSKLHWSNMVHDY